MDIKSGTIEGSTITATSTNSYGIGVRVLYNAPNLFLTVSDCTIETWGVPTVDPNGKVQNLTAGIQNSNSSKTLSITVNEPVEIITAGTAINFGVGGGCITNDEVKVTAGDDAESASVVYNPPSRDNAYKSKYVKIEPRYTITVTANPSDGGTVTGSDSYDNGDIVTMEANANPGYKFVNWTLDGTEVSTNVLYEFTVTENAEYVANFVESHTHCICGETHASVGDHTAE